jgi:hypothetical protein
MKKQIIPTLAGLLILLALGWYIDHIAHDQIAKAIRLIVYSLAYALITALVGVSLFAILLVRERLLKERATRKLAERDAAVLVVTADEGQQVYIRDTDQSTSWRNAHLDVRVYANGQASQPNPAELAAWQVYMFRHRPAVTDHPGLSLLPVQTQVDLLAALDAVQRCLIVGASDSGKTTLLQWLVSRRLQTSKVIVIDPHAYPDKWPHCVVVGTGRNYAEIDRALEALVRLMTKRYDEIGKGIVAEQGHTRITILIDEWRAIVYNVKGASEAIKALLTESRKAAFSVFVASHSDRAKPLGLEGEYDLKDGFAVVRLSMANGQRQATLDLGNGEVLATLPGPYPTQSSQLIEGEQPTLNLEVEPTPTEAHILNLYEAGETVSAIATAVYGSKGGNQNQQVKEVLRKYKGVEV